MKVSVKYVNGRDTPYSPRRDLQTPPPPPRGLRWPSVPIASTSTGGGGGRYSPSSPSPSSSSEEGGYHPTSPSYMYDSDGRPIPSLSPSYNDAISIGGGGGRYSPFNHSYHSNWHKSPLRSPWAIVSITPMY